MKSYDQLTLKGKLRRLAEDALRQFLISFPRSGVGMLFAALCAALGTLERLDLHSTQSAERGVTVGSC